MDPTLRDKLLGASFRFVSYRPRSEKEFREFLEKKVKKWKIDAQPVIDAVLRRLKELGYIDDKKFTGWWIEQRTTYKPKGAMLIKRELLQKGISREIIDESASPTSEKTLATSVLKRHWPKWQTLPLLERKKKAYALLGRRGFVGETITRVVDDFVKLGYNTSEETDRI